MLPSCELLVVALVVSYLPSVFSHGFVNQVVIDGKSYTGTLGGDGADKPDSVIRQVSGVEPIKGASNSELGCGHLADPATQIADAQPGSAMEVYWVGGGGQNWPHGTGPMLTYLAKCDGSCTSFDSKNAKWFKINQAGKTGEEWLQNDLMQMKPHTFKLPSNLAAGSYLLRHEIIALHNAVSVGGAEFYPSCSQINVGGSQTGAPKDSEFVSFPGAYDDNDPGIYVPNVYDLDGSDYKFPGPSIASFISGDTSGTSSSSSTKSIGTATSSSFPKPSGSTSSGSSSGGGSGKANSFTGKCTLRPGTNSLNYNQHAFARPRGISRIMVGWLGDARRRTIDH